MTIKVLLIILICSFTVKSYSQNVFFNVVAGLRTTNFVGTEPLGTSNNKLSYTGGALFGINNLATIGDDLMLNLNSGLLFELNNTEFKAKNYYTFNTFTSSIPIYISIMKKDVFQVGFGGFGDLNVVRYEGDINQFTDLLLPYDFINLFDYGIYVTAQYLIPHSNLNIFANYKLTLRKQMVGYQSVGPYGSLSEPYSGFRLQGFGLGIGVFILK